MTSKLRSAFSGHFQFSSVQASSPIPPPLYRLFSWRAEMMGFGSVLEHD